MLLLRWTLALVLGGQALVFLVHLSARGVPFPHVPQHLPYYFAIGSTELAGSILMLVPRTRTIGAACVIASLAGAAGCTWIEGARPPLAFVVYVAALFAVMQGGARRLGAGTP